ncbi:hypothetical protein cypCar_00016932, partial [Cyprinus carpio]
ELSRTDTVRDSSGSTAQIVECVSVCPLDALEIFMLALKLLFWCVCSGQNGRDYGFLVRQNSELLRALEEVEKSCNALREENRILRKSSSPETEEKVKRLRKKNTELAVIAKRLEDRARKLQEANLKVVRTQLCIFI